MIAPATKLLLLIALTGLLATGAVTYNQTANAARGGQAKVKVSTGQVIPTLPEGDWSLSCHPDFRAGFKTVPVYLYRLETDARKGLLITRVWLWNRSAKPVASVKIHWWLATEDNPAAVLLDGETPELKLEDSIKGNEVKVIEPALEPFTQMAKKLMSAGTFGNNHYRMEVAVTDIAFENGAAWTRATQPSKLEPAPLDEDCGTRTCQSQKCQFVRANGYQCATSLCERCEVVDTYSCLMRSCFGPVGL